MGWKNPVALPCSHWLILIMFATSHNHPKTNAKNYKLLCLFSLMNCGCQHMDAFCCYINVVDPYWSATMDYWKQYIICHSIHIYSFLHNNIASICRLPATLHNCKHMQCELPGAGMPLEKGRGIICTCALTLSVISQM
jgi:hypothetical protein